MSDLPLSKDELSETLRINLGKGHNGNDTTEEACSMWEALQSMAASWVTSKEGKEEGDEQRGNEVATDGTSSIRGDGTVLHLHSVQFRFAHAPQIARQEAGAVLQETRAEVQSTK